MKEEYPLTPAEALPETKFKAGDTVRLHPDYYNVSNTHKVMIGVKYVVKKCYFSDVGNMLAEVVYLENKKGVKNPYLAEYFEKVDDNEA